MPEYQMLGYIREVPEAVARTVESCRPGLDELQRLLATTSTRRVVVAGLGSSYTAAQMAHPALRHCSPVPVTVTVATELGIDETVPLDPNALVVLVSRSGERGGICTALAAAREAGAPCVAVTAVPTSHLASESDLVVLTGEGPETTYPKTKSVMGSAAALMALALTLDDDADRAAQLRAALSRMPELLESGLQSAEQSADYVAEQLARCQFALITGTAGNQGVAQEAALKIQECAAMPSQWDEAGSAYYGTVTILGPAWLLVSLVTRADYQLNRSLLKLAGRFGANRLCVAEPHLDLVDSTEHLLQVPESTERLLAPLLFLPPLYLLTYHLAVGRGLNPDEPVFSETMLRAMLPPGREEPDWGH